MNNFQKYELKEYRLAELESRVGLPKFQRGIVWKEKAIISFIETIRKGHPFGSILVYDDGEEKLLIDGLQRLTAIKKYKKEPIRYLETEINDIVTKEVSKIMSNDRVPLQVEYRLKVTTSLKKMIQNAFLKYNEDDVRANDSSNEAKNFIAEQTNLNEFIGSDNIAKHVDNIFKEILKNYNVDGIVIPAIIFKGDKTELADIFENLNKTGKKLSKYEVFAASWNDEILTIPYDMEIGKEIIESVLNFYEDLEKNGDIKITGLNEEEMRTTGKINVFEYCKALQKLVQKKVTILSENKISDSLVFSSLAGILGIKNTEMAKISNIVRLASLDYSFIAHLTNHILESISKINNVFEEYTTINDGSKNKKENHFVASDLQLASMIITYFNISYRIDEKTAKIIPIEGSSEKKKQFEKNIIGHYIYDLLAGNWKGSGDSRLRDVVYNQDYLVPIHEEYLDQELDKWKREHQGKQRQRISSVVKLLTVVTYNLEKRGLVHQTKIEQILSPTMEKNISNKEKNCGRLGNQIVIPSGIDNKDILVEKYNYPHHSELDFMNVTDIDAYKKFLRFLDNRENEIISKIIQHVTTEYAKE